MADPAWGTASSLSDEETARALCAFHDTEPLPTQRRRPLQQQQQAPLYRPSDQRSREVPQLGGGFSAFGYPPSSSYHMVPMTVQRSEAASVLVGMHAPSTSSDDWQRLQQRRIQQELEQQQRDLHAVTQSQQQQDMQRQLHQLQAQIQQQQQEQAHRHLQVQVQGQVERIQQPQYSSSGLGNFDQTRWNNGAYAQSLAAPSCSGADSGRIQGAAMQQNGRYHGGGSQQRAQPVPIRPATTPTGSSLYPAFSYGRGPQHTAVSTSRNDALFAPQQPAQSHFRARSTDLFGASALQSWGHSDSMSMAGVQAERTKSFQTHSEQRFVPQQPQPQPYYAAEPSERKYQEPAARSHASQSVSDVFFLDGVMKHFPASAEVIGEAPARSAAAPVTSNRDARENPFGFTPTQYRTQAQPPLGMQTQMEVQSRTTVPPTGAVIVPGVSLASQPIRLVTMRDLLNGDEAKADKSRGRTRGSQQRAPQKRKAPKKKAPAKRQRIPQQQNDQISQNPPTSRSPQPSQNSSLVPSGGPALTSKPAPPMYLAFMESRAARALEQKSGAARAIPSIPQIQAAQPRLSVPAAQVPARQTNNESVDLVVAEATPVKQKRRPYKRKKAGAPPDNQAQEQCLRTSVLSISTQATSKPIASSNAQLPELPQTSIATATQRVDDGVQVKDQANSSIISDDPVKGKFEERQEPPQLAVLADAAKNDQPSLSTDKAANGKLGKSSRRRRTAKLSRPGSNAPGIVRGEQQSVSSALPIPVGASTEAVSSTAIAAASSCADIAPRVENRTVVIFCKRDFMRYQAAKIWRKYQEQLKKQEEWREVRVAGKRTRYLNSRYDDELRRTHRKPTIKRAGNRPRGRAAAPKSQETNGHGVSTSAEGAAVVSSTPSAPTPASNGNDEGGHLAQDFGATSSTNVVDPGVSLDVCDPHSSGAGNAGIDSLLAMQGASDPRQENTHSFAVKQGEDDFAESVGGSRGLNELGDGMRNDPINSKERPATALDINSQMAVAGGQSMSNNGFAGVVTDVAPEDKALPSIAGVPSNGIAKLAISDGITHINGAGGGDTKGTGDKQTCAVPAVTSDDSVETCTKSAMSVMPNGVTTSDNGGNPAETAQPGADPSGGTTFIAKPNPESADLGTAKGGTAEIKQCTPSSTSNGLNLSKSAHADPVTNSNGGAAV